MNISDTAMMALLADAESALIEHHSSDVMKEKHHDCPVCKSPDSALWRIVNARRLLSASPTAPASARALPAPAMGLPDYEAALQRERALADQLAAAIRSEGHDDEGCFYVKSFYSGPMTLALRVYDEARKS